METKFITFVAKLSEPAYVFSVYMNFSQSVKKNS